MALPKEEDSIELWLEHNKKNLDKDYIWLIVGYYLSQGIKTLIDVRKGTNQ